MRKFLSAICLGLASLSISCGTEPPNGSTTVVTDAKIIVSTSPSGAAIWLDGVNTGRVTPDSVAVASGSHTVQLLKTNFDAVTKQLSVSSGSSVAVTASLRAKDKVTLIEDFSNVSCIPCVTSNPIIEQLANQTYGRAKVLVIKYPTNFPSPSDPLFTANTTDCNSRISYYSVFSAPTTILDGRTRPTATDSIALKDSVDIRLQEPSKFKITVRDSIASGIYYSTVTVQTYDTTGTDFNNLVLQTVVTETDITFATAPGANGERVFYDVMRKMLPTNAGESLAASNQTGTVTYQRQVPLAAAWVVSKLHTVAFVQNKLTKVVYQAGSTF